MRQGVGDWSYCELWFCLFLFVRIVAMLPMSMLRRAAVRRTAVRRGAECEDVHHDKGKNDRYGGDACGDGKAAALGERSVNVSDDENHTGYEQDTRENQ